MKKKLLSAAIAVVIVIGLAIAVFPVSRAAATPYFTVVNDTLLPLNDNTIPLIHNGIYFVPHATFSGLGIFSAASARDARVLLYTEDISITFHVGGTTTDQDGNTLRWPSARRDGNRLYVPLRQVAEHFGLSYEIIEVSNDVIPDANISLIRITSDAAIIPNAATFAGMRAIALRTAYNQYFTQPDQPTTPPEDLPPDHSDVTVYLSFYDISAGSAGEILNLLATPAAPNFRASFFVSADDIINNPGLIRKIFGSGHAIGIWLTDGTYEEYLHASALLFEAAKVTTVLVSAGYALEMAIETADLNELIFWDASMSFASGVTASGVTGRISTVSGARQNLRFTCCENTAAALPGIFSFLRAHNYTAGQITETVEPITQ